MKKNDEIKVVGGFGNKCNKGTQWHNQNRIYDNKVAACIPTAFQPYYLTHTHTHRRVKWI